jgi:predicted Zn-ribbon and HTH transcriptional regulator
MSERSNYLTPDELAIAQAEIGRISQHNIFCHCRNCGYEWVDSTKDVSCPKCRDSRIEAIACWQFPDD